MLRFLGFIIGLPIAIAGVLGLLICSVAAYVATPDARWSPIAGLFVSFFVLYVGQRLALGGSVSHAPDDFEEAALAQARAIKASARADLRAAEAAEAVATAVLLAARKEAAKSASEINGYERAQSKR